MMALTKEMQLKALVLADPRPYKADSTHEYATHCAMVRLARSLEAAGADLSQAYVQGALHGFPGMVYLPGVGAVLGFSEGEVHGIEDGWDGRAEPCRPEFALQEGYVDGLAVGFRLAQAVRDRDATKEAP